ncbi:terminase small subunit [Lacticaseibacillus paracasei]|uniref:terminase small subunit n=1 Tax=Lacticaseibacillus paracasei TaxID=1597 RepID=UPI000D70510E|nr:terminase small subunit [Lacticaseibacillus paracasei]AWN84609.1 terminase small subunit [Lacticaseibacillus paracasei]
MRLTAKQQKFADYYIELGNAAEAARKAGYSKRTARSIGQENLTKPDVKEYISKRLEELANERVADQQEVLEFLTRLIRREESDQVVVTLKKPTSVMLKNKDGKSYSKFAYEDVDDVVDVKTKNSDAIKAADILSRLQGMGNNANNTLTENQSRKVSAEADIMEAKAKRETSEDTSNITINIKPIQQDGGDDSAD